ncbi:MAG: M48 family metalloprotease [Bryobacteraceae bacterium]|nr:M48 family metalloprotease [Bryobacteraceae bacterium]
MTSRLLIPLFAALAHAQPNAVDRLLDEIVKNEREFLTRMQTLNPIMETYLQEEPDGPDEGPRDDQYFLGRVSLAGGVDYESFLDPATQRQRARGKQILFKPAGFAQMMIPDATNFDRQTYSFEFVRREFLGEVRCLVFDVSPRVEHAPGRFIGRIWVEDRDRRIVRVNGTFTPAKVSRWGANVDLYFNFDSWRVNVAAGRWVPAYVYVENANPVTTKQRIPKFKAQTRFWGYDAGGGSKLTELTSMLIESESAVADGGGPKQNTPLESQRMWERQAEENVLERLDKSGLLAPKGDVDKVLNAVVNNLLATNNLNLEVECRVLMTTPLESFSVGHAIVISRGLIDVLPDEASLAMVLAAELAHIALGHRTETQFAFANRTMLSDTQVLNRFRFRRPDADAAAAGQKAIGDLRKSPYSAKLNNAGLFLQAVAARAPRLPGLIQANLGNQLASGETFARLSELAKQAPPLAAGQIEQIAALPLGSRVKADPWSNQLTLLKTKSVELLSAREKLPFEVTPFVLHLTRTSLGKPNGATGE